MFLVFSRANNHSPRQVKVVWHDQLVILCDVVQSDKPPSIIKQRVLILLELRNKIIKCIKVNSVQEACAKCFAVHILKFEILQIIWKNKTKNIKMLIIWVKNWKLRVLCSLFHFFIWFARFQILICEVQSIWRKLLILSSYNVNNWTFIGLNFQRLH